MDEKIKKSDQILSQIMQALVAHLGLRLSSEELKQLSEPSTNLAMCPTPSLSPKTANTLPSLNSPTPNSKPENQFSETAFAAKVQKAVTDEEIKSVVDQLPAEAADRIQNSQRLKPEQLQVIQGNFEGTLTYFEKNRKVRTTIETLIANDTSGKITGNHKLVIYTSDGQPGSTSTRSGDLYKEFRGSNVSIIFESGKNYLELVYFPERDILAGNFFEMKNAKLTKAGYAVYRRL